MEAFQSALDALSKESKEQILLVQEAAAAAVLHAHVIPHRIAVAVAQRFTPARVAAAYPVLCFIDATLVRTSSSTAAAAADQALAAVLKEFWEMATSAFASLHDYGASQPAWRDKCLRMVRRWRQRKLLKEEAADELLRLIEEGAVAEGDPYTADEVTSDANTSNSIRDGPAGGTADRHLSGSSTATTSAGRADLSTHARRSGAAPPAPAAMSFTAAQAQNFRATLQACMSALESLPAPRKALYLDLVHAQHFRTPTRTSLLFYEELLGELRREVTAAAYSAHGGVSAEAGGERNATRKDDHGVDAASDGHAREALGKLFDQLHAGNAEDHTSAGGRPAGGSAHTTATTVVRYASPIFSDIYAKQPLGQRGTGFGVLQRKAEHGSTSNAFYTSYYPKPVGNAQRPFRIPATRQMQGGTVRLWFPRPQQWVSTADMADLAQYASRNVLDKDRKRGREEA
ncbi:hypothetical protein ABB37_06350 [Leptomonas pyrrhocoris]|uniref:CID domain-containing protein n=1 Tax=Leptomonas pyrrhocoris TaxID=157538 RepID=A0A0N0DU83_LEPPY|nr:hypothetical protein ABB37_06350 [Leptomonas pyrrhocoris]XP_015656621.1 hypothetical protein ABB37_06350 [Leptomonas pyrrhocoris]XP_015656622.1 hypothetical protein ABB37_06350 [Leptomonas pyrrhocoris]KPA78181.1 hypothetical protein ABB37_06350 [Leptomonas pyrrhocoris]KPA78182.1 hypothetical protein ABB37_06350 [Leptomonas pyrrhocoris]KPA78183.1 hypothetical protein ABB37_06350 [Leptomonas pyrrhocoris]|eukprot:XP_015656620.1 hypothetical protein ABB37_06350 [Leptomonas pyrrhocoris]